MCQGVIISLVKFTTPNGKRKTIMLKGIGSHSDLVKEGKEKLLRAGWKESGANESIISIESDFSGWNRYTIESGSPSKSEIAILNREYKKIAGSAKTLILHVKKMGIIDEALINLLSPGARKTYEDARASILKTYEDARASILKTYEDAHSSIRKTYEDACASIWIKLFSTKKNRIEYLQS